MHLPAVFFMTSEQGMPLAKRQRKMVREETVNKKLFRMLRQKRFTAT